MKHGFDLRLVLPVFLLAFLGSGCREMLNSAQVMIGSRSPSSGSTSTKQISSLWDGGLTAPSLDFRALRVPAAQTVRIDFEGGVACECSSQTTSGGAILLMACHIAIGSSADPGCAKFNDQYTTHQDPASLQICDSVGSCNRWQ